MPTNKRLHWDGTITAGNALTAGVLLLALLGWGFRLEGRVDQHDYRIAQNEERNDDTAGAVASAVESVENRINAQLIGLRSDISELRAVFLGRPDMGRP